MNFRIITLGTHQILLERFYDEGEHQVYIMTYMDQTKRYEVWDNFKTAELAQAFIEQYEFGQAKLFLERGKAWYASVMN